MYIVIKTTKNIMTLIFTNITFDNDKKIFRDTVVEQMVAETLQSDGTCFETFRRINVFARK